MIPAEWENIPDELKFTPKWCIAAPDKSPFTLAGKNASVTKPANWCDWYSAATTAASWGNGAGIGFVLGEDDDFACIDLDVKDDTSPERVARFLKIIEAFDSYTERSRSGKGYHVWVRGRVGAGCRREGVEVYSQQRFIICTGDVVNKKPVENRQELLDLLVSEIRAASDTTQAVLVEKAETEGDREIFEKAKSAANSEKFGELWAGDWAALGYPSQSEADMALLSNLCFYSQSNEQVRRLFRMSALGKREKAVRNNRYLDRSLAIIRGREERDSVEAETGRLNALALIGRANPAPLIKNAAEPPLDWPPGIVGELAKWFYSIAPRPVREVAIVSALGVVAGIYGRAYNISGSGLNLYIVLVARSAVGKEAMHSGISKLCHTMMASEVPGFSYFINFNDYASGPALVKAVAGSDVGSFVNVAGEWGRKLRKMSDDNSDGPMSSLRTVMTNLYQKSSAGTIVGGIGYSDKEKNIASVDGVAYSLIGETTPDTFYESLTNTMMQDGFMSRFIVIEYAGLRPEFNTATSSPLPDSVLYTLANGAVGALKATGKDVAMSREAQTMLDAFDKSCDLQINSTDDESWRQMWNRAHLKALKVSALLAVSDNPLTPVVTSEHAEWALGLVHRDIKIMGRKMASGDVGDGDVARERKMLSVLADYLQAPLAAGYKVPDEMRLAGVVARKYLQIRLQRTNSFMKHRLGQTMALDTTIRSLCDSGYLAEVSKDKIPAEWGFHGKAYRILSLPDTI